MKQNIRKQSPEMEEQNGNEEYAVVVQKPGHDKQEGMVPGELNRKTTVESKEW